MNGMVPTSESPDATTGFVRPHKVSSSTGKTLPQFIAPRTVIVVDDDPSSWRGIARYSEQYDYVPIAFDSANSFIDWLCEIDRCRGQAATQVCIVFDAKFSDMFDMREITRYFSHSPRICISRSAKPSLTLKSIRLGLFDFIEKPFRVLQLAQIIDRALAYSDVIPSIPHGPEAIEDSVTSLTRREAEIFQLLAQGLSSKAIAYKLGIAIKTFYVHRSNLLAKTGAKCDQDLAHLHDALPEHHPLRWPVRVPSRSI